MGETPSVADRGAMHGVLSGRGAHVESGSAGSVARFRAGPLCGL